MNNKNEITLVIGDTLDITFELKSEYQIKGISEPINAQNLQLRLINY